MNGEKRCPPQMMNSVKRNLINLTQRLSQRNPEGKTTRKSRSHGHCDLRNRPICLLLNLTKEAGGTPQGARGWRHREPRPPENSVTLDLRVDPFPAQSAILREEGHRRFIA